MLGFLLGKDITASTKWSNFKIVTNCTYFYPDLLINLKNVDH